MIFADSSYFIAIADKKDQWHKRAKELSKKAAKLVVTDLVLSESVTSVGARGGGKTGLDIYQYISDNCDLVFTNKDILEKAMDIFLKYDGTLSVADAVSIHVMNIRGITEIASFDSDFDKVDGIARLS